MEDDGRWWMMTEDDFYMEDDVQTVQKHHQTVPGEKLPYLKKIESLGHLEAKFSKFLKISN